MHIYEGEKRASRKMFFVAKLPFRFILYFLVTKFILTLKYWNRFGALEQIGEGYRGRALRRREEGQRP